MQRDIGDVVTFILLFLIIQVLDHVVILEQPLTENQVRSEVESVEKKMKS